MCTGFSLRNVAAGCWSYREVFASCHLAPLPKQISSETCAAFGPTDRQPKASGDHFFLGRRILQAASPYREPCVYVLTYTHARTHTHDKWVGCRLTVPEVGVDEVQAAHHAHDVFLDAVLIHESRHGRCGLRCGMLLTLPSLAALLRAGALARPQAAEGVPDRLLEGFLAREVLPCRRLAWRGTETIGNEPRIHKSIRIDDRD